MEKCEFHQSSITFLGFILAEGQSRMNPSKVDSVLQWPTLINHMEVQRFIRFANFYRKFIRNFNSITAPLHALTSSRNSFDWDVTCQEGFDRLRSSFTTAPVLIMPDPERQFLVEGDASDSGMGAILS
ncbi:uncharacterized protein LOC133505925 [Syngnathoides biaculeatus]|uniref:uncharacterized protein LOC133505925 n=1 Tax=Syngnathoides biaculeatus TaxID=300417 RepID=UPI002ADD3BA9|nr:uncharacterized protein LOC133505925 [Syngnathoides biaculeatus]